MRNKNTEPVNSMAINAQVARVDRATAKEDASIDAPMDNSFNSGRI
jgi:hypothetical protein